MEIVHAVVHTTIDRRARNGELLKAIGNAKPGSEEIPIIAERLLRNHWYFAAASLYAGMGMVEKAIGIAREAHDSQNSGKYYPAWCSDDPLKMHMLVEVAAIYIEFDPKYGRGRAHRIAEDCELIIRHIGKHSYKERYAATAGEIYSMLGMHGNAAEMFEIALNYVPVGDWGNKWRYLKEAEKAYRGMGNHQEAVKIGRIADEMREAPSEP